jgi:hypothetical protein
VRQVANDTNTALAAAGATSRRFISVQVETAWGRLGNQSGPFLGIEQDFTDFPFMQAVGLSSYPYLAWTSPSDLPADYYSRLRGADPADVGVRRRLARAGTRLQLSAQTQASYIDGTRRCSTA